MAVNGTNGHHTHVRHLKPGIYAPIPTFFLSDTEDIDVPSFATHIIRLAKAGVHPLISGSMGEAHHLSHSERTTLIHAARLALDEAGFKDMPIIAGTGAGSTRETIELCAEAAKAGADAVIVIISGYFAGALVGNKQALKAFWAEVAEKSPLPVIIYNYPGAAGGIDLDSTIITELARECPNIVGVKLTCGNVGKLTRICSIVSEQSFLKTHPRKNPEDRFLVLGGFADFLLPSAFVNAHGAITGLANVAPHTLSHLFNMISSPTHTDLGPSQKLQGVVSNADYTIAKAGIAGTKVLIEKSYGYGGKPRKPLVPLDEAEVEALWSHPDTQAIIQVERELNGKGK